jgi:hypothetical protein
MRKNEVRAVDRGLSSEAVSKPTFWYLDSPEFSLLPALSEFLANSATDFDQQNHFSAIFASLRNWLGDKCVGVPPPK